MSSKLAGVIELPAWPDPEPAAWTVPSDVVTWDAADDAAVLAASAGLHLDPWQVQVLRAGMGLAADGRWASFEVGLCCPRQNGKSKALEARVLAGLFLHGENILWTAHEFKTAQLAFRSLSQMIESTPHLRRRVKRIRTANGDESIQLESGAELRFVARSKSSGRGFSADLIVLDEAQHLSADALGALLPTLAARATATQQGQQVWYAGSAGDEEAEVWVGLRDRGRAHGTAAVTWVEYAAATDAVAAVDLGDLAAALAANPSMSAPEPRMEPRTLEALRLSMSDEEFGREMLGLWTLGRRASLVDADAWWACRDPKSKPGPVKVFAVDTSPERVTSIAVASWLPDGRPHVEVVAQESGTRWAIPKLVALVAKWSPPAVVLDARALAGSLLADLTRADVPVDVIQSRHYAAACGALLDRVTDRQVVHTGQAQLTDAIDGARKRPVGDAWAWHRRDTSVDIAPLVAVTLALHGLMSAKPDPDPVPSRKPRAMFV